MRNFKNSLSQKNVIFTIFFIAISMWAPLAAGWEHINTFKNNLAIPSGLPPGSVVSRYPLLAQEACGRDACIIKSVKFFDLGSSIEVQGPNVRTIVSGISARIMADGVILQNGTYPSSPVQGFEIQLIRDGREMEQSGEIIADLAREYFQVGFTNGRDMAAIRIQSKITIIPGACFVENKNIKLQDISAFKLNGVGKIAGTVPFSVGIYNCPAGFNSIKYSINQIYNGANSQNGVLNPSGSSTAKGVAIQISDDTNHPIEFNSFSEMGYLKSGAQSQNFSIALKASYIQTDANVTPGYVESGVRILLDYQ